MPRPLKVFLCHAHSDKDTVKALYARLKREGVDVWLDKEKLLPGADWEFEIRKAVRESDVVIVCLSKQFNQAGFRQKEVRIALEEADNKPPGEIFIIPARLEECDNLPTLTKWHWVDLFESDGFQRLILALRIRAEKIGAALRQRGATQSRPKKYPEQPVAEKEGLEKARRDDEERQRLAKEQADREAAEKAERDRLAREAEENTKRENTEREAAEKAERDRLDRDAAEKAENDRLNKEAAAKAERDRLARVARLVRVANEHVAKQQAEPPTSKQAVEKKRELAPKLNARGLVIAGGIFACLMLAAFGGNYLFKNLPSSPTFIPTLGIISPQVSNTDSMTMIFVPAGEFMMGSNTGSSDEQPVHSVNLDAFWIDQTEVTNAMYKKCVDDGDCKSPGSSKSNSQFFYFGKQQFDSFPVINVTWSQAYQYCIWAGRKLPNEAQWEKAARGTDLRVYPWGNSMPSRDLMNYFNYVGDTVSVSSYPNGISFYGAFDMAGNVYEWVSSLYQPYPYNNNDGRESLNNTGTHILRGGSWYSSGNYARTTARTRYSTAIDLSTVGFRCAMDATP